jgi:hypothetical protein
MGENDCNSTVIFIYSVIDIHFMIFVEAVLTVGNLLSQLWLNIVTLLFQILNRQCIISFGICCCIIPSLP